MMCKYGQRISYEELKEHNVKTMWGRAVIDYAERWAALMEAAVAVGDISVEMVDRTASEADAFDLSGSMGDVACSVLIRYWAYSPLVVAKKRGQPISLLELMAEVAAHD